MKKVLEIGQQSGDLTGNSDLVIQCAVDYLSNLGGGTVKIKEGVYEIGSSIHLRPNINLEGIPGKTILRKCDNVCSLLATEGDANERQLTLASPDGFEPGHTVTVRFEGENLGFLETVAVVTGKEGNVITIDRGLLQDYEIKDKRAVAERNFPVISGYHCENNMIKGITIDGNRAHNSLVDGCRNAGIYFFESKNIVIENCTVERYNGDGISYQVCGNVTVRNCVLAGNAGHGLHPGSGTTVTFISGCKSYENGCDGIFVCWRVTKGMIEDCISYKNDHNGLSIGHKDTNNIIRNNHFYENRHSGMLFRNEIEPMGANYNLVENNTIANNGSEEYAGKTGCTFNYTGIRICGCTHDLRFVKNKISNRNFQGRDTAGIVVEKEAYNNFFDDNIFEGCTREIAINRT